MIKSETKERPILFSGGMVRALLDGRKTQTRRVMKPQPFCSEHGIFPAGGRLWQAAGEDRQGRRAQSNASDEWHCPYGQPGDRLWVRETYCLDEAGAVCFFADAWTECPAKDGRWKPSIFMRRAFSRIVLEVTGVRVERVQEIGKDGRKAKDVLAEGITRAEIALCGNGLDQDDAPAHAYAVLWDSINGKTAPWTSNPWVWVVEFRRVEGGCLAQ